MDKPQIFDSGHWVHFHCSGISYNLHALWKQLALASRQVPGIYHHSFLLLTSLANMCDIEIEKMKSEKTVNNAFSTLDRKADHDGERQTSLTISSLKKQAKQPGAGSASTVYLKKNPTCRVVFPSS